MTITSSEQTLQLEPMVPGTMYMLVITKNPGAHTLQFKHQDDPTPANHPDHTNVTGAVIVKQFICPSPIMAIAWTAPPASPYFVSVLPVTSPEF